MPAAEVSAALEKRYQAEGFAGGVEVQPGVLRDCLRALRDDHGYRFYVMASATDRGETLEIVHAVRNLETNDTFCVKAAVAGAGPEIDSVVRVYAGAEWHEREILDMFGVRFAGHPDPRRILMPDDYPGHPLRKQFALDTAWGYRRAPVEPQDE